MSVIISAVIVAAAAPSLCMHGMPCSSHDMHIHARARVRAHTHTVTHTVTLTHTRALQARRERENEKMRTPLTHVPPVGDWQEVG